MNQTIEKILKFSLNECCPAALRDNRFFMWLPFKIAFGDKSEFFLSFKNNISENKPEYFRKIYKETSSVSIQDNETDLSKTLVRMIQNDLIGESVLDVGCGKGKLVGSIGKNRKLAGCDIVIDDETRLQYPYINFHESGVEKLLLDNNSFDTVTCTHTLEHVWDLSKAVKELRRVAAKRLIVVLPIERPFKYSFNLHIHFFMFEYQIHMLFKERAKNANFVLKRIEDCWYYYEDIGE